MPFSWSYAALNLTAVVLPNPLSFTSGKTKGMSESKAYHAETSDCGVTNDSPITKTEIILLLSSIFLPCPTIV